MAQKRMFSLKVIDTDLFIEMPQSTRLLYYELCMRADDDGFVASPNKIRKITGCSEDDYKILMAKQYVIPFESGICVIKHWRIHNLIRSDRYNETEYRLEKSILIDNNGKYEFGMTNGMTQVRLGKDSIGKVKLDKTNYSEFVKLTVAEYDRLFSEFGEDAVKRMIEILDNYKGANGKKYADDNRAIRNWVVKRWQDEEAQTKLFDGKSLSVAEKARRLQEDYERNNSFKTDNANKGYISVL